MKTIRITTLAAAIAATFITSPAFAHEGEDHGTVGTSTVPTNYPFTKCVVSGDKLSSHGRAVKVTYKGTDVYLCCKSCVKDFDKDPAKYVKQVRDAASKK